MLSGDRMAKGNWVVNQANGDETTKDLVTLLTLGRTWVSPGSRRLTVSSHMRLKIAEWRSGGSQRFSWEVKQRACLCSTRLVSVDISTPNISFCKDSPPKVPECSSHESDYSWSFTQTGYKHLMNTSVHLHHVPRPVASLTSVSQMTRPLSHRWRSRFFLEVRQSPQQLGIFGSFCDPLTSSQMLHVTQFLFRSSNLRIENESSVKLPKNVLRDLWIF